MTHLAILSFLLLICIARLICRLSALGDRGRADRLGRGVCRALAVSEFVDVAGRAAGPG